MNHIELNAILYYADFLSLKAKSQPVTDNCKYFFIHGAPINSAFIVDLEPLYDESNEYYLQALNEYTTIRDKYGDEGVESFIDDVCSIKACGSVGAEQMLQCIHQFSDKREKKQAFNVYYIWRNNQVYTHTVINEDGKPEERPCTRYTYHYERMLERSGMAESLRTHSARYEVQVEKSFL